MTSLQELMERYRRASRDTFNAHFLPHAETERDFEVFARVDDVLYQVMVLDLLGVSAADPLSLAAVRFRPAREGVEGALQNKATVPATFGSDCICEYESMFGAAGSYAARELDFVIGTIVEARDPQLVGEAIAFDWRDVTFIGESRW